MNWSSPARSAVVLLAAQASSSTSMTALGHVDLWEGGRTDLVGRVNAASSTAARAVVGADHRQSSAGSPIAPGGFFWDRIISDATRTGPGGLSRDVLGRSGF